MLFISKEEYEGFNIYELEETTSTNDVLKSQSDLSTSIVILAQNQTCGRGRRSNIWQSARGNLYFSYNQYINLQDLSKIVCLIALTLAQTIKQLSNNIDVKIKWPNDIMVNGCKISGILLENIKDNMWCIGIGVNITSSPKLYNTSYPITSLKEEGIILDRKEFLHYYLKNYKKEYQNYKDYGFDTIKKEYLNLALNLNHDITIKTEQTLKKGTFITIDDNGYLILRQEDREEKIIVGELFI